MIIQYTRTLFVGMPTSPVTLLIPQEKIYFEFRREQLGIITLSQTQQNPELLLC